MKTKELTKPQNGIDKKPDSTEAQKLKNLILFNKKYLNRPPEPHWIAVNKWANNAKYIPIRIIENLLWSTFGVWQAEQIGKPQIIGNCVEVTIQLRVFHPVIQDWITLPGTGAVPIELKATKIDQKTKAVIEEGARNALDFERINPKALHKNVPAALSFAINNAAKKLGKRFGSDLNSDEGSETYNIYG